MNKRKKKKKRMKGIKIGTHTITFVSGLCLTGENVHTRENFEMLFTALLDKDLTCK